MKTTLGFLSVIILFACNSGTQNTSASEDTTATEEMAEPDLLDTTGSKGVFFAELKDSQEVKSPLMVKMSVVGMEVEKAGPVNPLKGHHHLIIDGEPTPEGEPVIKDDTHLHLGLAQTETEVKLTPGFHKLTLQFANGLHASFGERWSRTITVKVK